MIGRILNTARTAGLKGGIIMFSNPVQQFLDDNDLQADEKFYILNSSHENLCDKTFYINKDFKEPEDILKCNGEKNGHAYTFLALLTGKFSVKKKSFHPQNGDIYYYVTALGEIEKRYVPYGWEIVNVFHADKKYCAVLTGGNRHPDIEDRFF